MSKKEQNKNSLNNSRQNSSRRGFSRDIIKVVEKQTPEEYWGKVRDTVFPEYLSVFDTTDSTVIKNILCNTALVNPDFHFLISLHDFEKLTEKDFLEIKKITSIVKIRFCTPSLLILAIFKKKEYEHYSIDFKVSEESINDIFKGDLTGVKYYTVSFK